MEKPASTHPRSTRAIEQGDFGDEEPELREISSVPAEDLKPIPGAGANVKDDVTERIKEAIKAKKAREKAAESKPEARTKPAPLAEGSVTFLSMGPAAVLSIAGDPSRGPSGSLAEQGSVEKTWRRARGTCLCFGGLREDV